MTDTPISAPVQQPSIAADPMQIAALPPEQRASLLNTYRKAGFLQPELDRVFGGEAKPAPQLSRDQQHQARYDQSFSPGASPDQYDVTSVLAGRGADPALATEVSADIRGAFHSMMVPGALAPALASAFFEGIDNRPEVGDELASWQGEQRRIAEKVGGDTAENLTALAAYALARVAPDVREGLIGSGALDAASSIVLLAQHATRLKAQGK